jgi:hypothetical protein
VQAWNTELLFIYIEDSRKCRAEKLGGCAAMRINKGGITALFFTPFYMPA